MPDFESMSRRSRKADNQARSSTLTRISPRTGLYYPNLVPMSAIRRYVRKIVALFHPDEVVLFGSYASGTPTRDSDVDLLVVMATRNQLEQAIRIDEAIEERGFPLDLLVRTPKVLAAQVRMGDSFMLEIMTHGRVMYEKSRAGVGAQSRKRSRRRAIPVQTQTTVE